MTVNFDQACVELDRQLFVRIVDAAGTSVTCISGCLWTTRDGCPKDIEARRSSDARVGARGSSLTMPLRHGMCGALGWT
jgi:hypothetical protein